MTRTQLLAELDALRWFLHDHAARWDATPTARRVVRETVRPAAQRLTRLLSDAAAR